MSKDDYSNGDYFLVTEGEGHPDNELFIIVVTERCSCMAVSLIEGNSGSSVTVCNTDHITPEEIGELFSWLSEDQYTYVKKEKVHRRLSCLNNKECSLLEDD